MATYLGQPIVAAIFAQSSAITPDAASPMPWLQPDQASVDSVTLTDDLGPAPGNSWPGQPVYQSSGTFDFFEDFHVIPRSFDFGNLLSDQSTAIEVFSAFRHDVHTWISVTNNAGAGVSLGGDPPLPALVPPLTGFQMTLDVSAIGAFLVDGSLVFVFDNGSATVPIEIQRITLWGLEPEMPFVEILGFLTDIMRALAGNEQRVSLRKSPRQTFPYEYVIEEGEPRQVLENLLFDWQSRNFGVPAWWFDTELTGAALAGDLSLAVASTDYRDFRVGGLVVVYSSQQLFDVIEIASFTATTITLAAQLINGYPVATKVFPLSACRITRVVRGERYPVGLARIAIEFEVLDNDVDLADVSAFSTFNSKVLLDNGNSLRGPTTSETFEREIVIIDNQTGVPVTESTWDRHKRGHTFILRASGRQAVWEMRQLVYALRGMQVSFYVPRSSADLVVVANLVNATNTMDVTNVGYAQFVRQRQPKNVILLSFNNGDPPLLRTITGSTNTSPTVDQLVVDINWPSTILPSTIERIEYVEKVRLDSDDVRIEYDESGHRARLVSPIKAVFE